MRVCGAIPWRIKLHEDVLGRGPDVLVKAISDERHHAMLVASSRRPCLPPPHHHWCSMYPEHAGRDLRCTATQPFLHVSALNCS